MDAHAGHTTHTHSATATHGEEHPHPTAGLYAKVGLVLFVLTALEVGLYEITYGSRAGPSARAIMPFFVPLLLLLSAAKFALVAMFYMHLKQDSKLFTGVFVFPLIIAAVVIVSLIILMAYHMAFARAA
jgi:cytochrome c oxidase subunit 4